MSLKDISGHGTAALHSISTTVHLVRNPGAEKKGKVSILLLDKDVPTKSSNVKLLNWSPDGTSPLHKSGRRE